MEIVSVPIIVSVVCVIMQLLKGVFKSNSNFLRLIPVLSAVIGALIGVIVFYSAPAMIPAANAFMALLIGGASGLASTGCHQIFKQLKSDSGSDERSQNDNDSDKSE